MLYLFLLHSSYYTMPWEENVFVDTGLSKNSVELKFLCVLYVTKIIIWSIIVILLCILIRYLYQYYYGLIIISRHRSIMKKLRFSHHCSSFRNTNHLSPIRNVQPCVHKFTFLSTRYTYKLLFK